MNSSHRAVWMACLGGENGLKEKCKVLRKHLAPSDLQTAVEQALRFAEKEVKSTPRLLYKLILIKALEQDKMHQLRRKNERQPPGEAKPPHGTTFGKGVENHAR
jgi:hypothetical protein